VRQYFFDLVCRATTSADHDGEWLPDLPSAECAAARILTEILPMHASELQAGEAVRVMVRESDAPVYVIETRVLQRGRGSPAGN